MIGEERAEVGALQQPDAEVDERQRADQAGDLAEGVDQAVADGRGDGGDRGEEDDPRCLAEMGQLADRLPGQHAAAGEEPDVHHDDQGQRDHRAAHPELGPRGDHLRQAQPRPLGGVQRHHRTAQEVAEQQPDQRPEGVRPEDDGQRAGDDGGDLEVGAQPERELADRAAVPFVVGDDVDGALFDHTCHESASHCCLYGFMQDRWR